MREIQEHLFQIYPAEKCHHFLSIFDHVERTVRKLMDHLEIDSHGRVHSNESPYLNLKNIADPDSRNGHENLQKGLTGSGVGYVAALEKRSVIS